MKFISSILILGIFVVTGLPQSKCDPRLENLKLKTRVLNVKPFPVENGWLRIGIKLETTFHNEGNEPIIILKPSESGDDTSTIGAAGISLYGSNEYGLYPLQSNAALPSVCLGCDNKLGRRLNEAVPPEKYATILKPGESWMWVTDQSFGFIRNTSSGIYGWNEVETNRLKLIGKAIFTMFPTNLESYKPGFGKGLKKRWQKYGVLFFCGTHSLITSQPFDIDLTGIKF